MWQYVFLLLRRQPGRSALASSGFLLAACALILLSATTQTTVVQANQIISQSWRSSYDLVVLPASAHITSKNIIPDDLMEGYDGGISMQQYQQIKSLPGVAVAAPIAYLGYVQMPVPQLNFFVQSLPTGYYQVNMTLLAFNGQHQIVERRISQVFYHLPTCDTQPPQKVLDALYEKGVIFDCTSTFEGTFSQSTLDTGTFLLAAIDPTAENQLVHLDRSVTSGRMLSVNDSLHFDTRQDLGSALDCPPGATSDTSKCSRIPNIDIPVLFHMQLPGQITLKSTFTQLASATLTPQIALARGGASYLTHLTDTQILYDGTVPLTQNDP
jgi:hypothetical protein